MLNRVPGRCPGLSNPSLSGSRCDPPATRLYPPLKVRTPTHGRPVRFILHPSSFILSPHPSSLPRPPALVIGNWSLVISPNRVIKTALPSRILAGAVEACTHCFSFRGGLRHVQPPRSSPGASPQNLRAISQAAAWFAPPKPRALTAELLEDRTLLSLSFRRRLTWGHLAATGRMPRASTTLGRSLARRIPRGPESMLSFTMGQCTTWAHLTATARLSRAINDAGQVVGEAATAGSQFYPWHAFLYDGTMHDLGTLGGLADNSSCAGGHQRCWAGRWLVGYCRDPCPCVPLRTTEKSSQASNP